MGFHANGAGSFRAGTPTLAASDDNGSNHVVVCCLPAHHQRNTAEDADRLVVGSLMAHSKRHGHAMGTQQAAEGGHLVVAYITPRICRNSESCNEVGIKEGDVADSLSTDGPGAVAFVELGEGHATYQETETAASMRTNTGGADGSEDGTGRGVPQAFNIVGLGQQGRNHAYETDVSGCLQHKGMVVRRLLPVECLRLQGLPDNHLDLKPPLSDSAKYRLIGNSVAVPVVSWIAERIALESER